VFWAHTSCSSISLFNKDSILWHFVLPVLALTKGLLRSGHGTFQAYGNFSLYPYMKTSFGWISALLSFSLRLSHLLLFCLQHSKALVSDGPWCLMVMTVVHFCNNCCR
jgi:hypothetical protein